MVDRGAPKCAWALGASTNVPVDLSHKESVSEVATQGLPLDITLTLHFNFTKYWNIYKLLITIQYTVYPIMSTIQIKIN